ncbi:thioredoxin family protein [Bacillus sp. Marseille-P3661]|uniref:thioredoxin family protein n=1 Tax=Bacillus sp. Marseille-P3661 TaxID=1936234 RepID=UPI00215558F2|nr:thioredoxin family protein [Bacillus sp. Marseille-P3661]
MTFSEYVEKMMVNRSELEGIYNKLELNSDDVQYFSKLKDKKLRIITLTADWCGDAALCVPVMQRLAEIAMFETRFLIRDENLELMDQYLTNGTARSIPIFIIIDEDGLELAVWGPRSPEVQQIVTEMRSKLPTQDAPDFLVKQKEMFASFKKLITTDTLIWQSVIRDIRNRFETHLR